MRVGVCKWGVCTHVDVCALDPTPYAARLCSLVSERTGGKVSNLSDRCWHSQGPVGWLGPPRDAPCRAGGARGRCRDPLRRELSAETGHTCGSTVTGSRSYRRPGLSASVSPSNGSVDSRAACVRPTFPETSGDSARSSHAGGARRVPETGLWGRETEVEEPASSLSLRARVSCVS